MDSPLRPLAPRPFSPLGLVVKETATNLKNKKIKTSKIILKSSFFLYSPPFPLSWLSTKKRNFFAASLTSSENHIKFMISNHFNLQDIRYLANRMVTGYSDWFRISGTTLTLPSYIRGTGSCWGFSSGTEPNNYIQNKVNLSSLDVR